MYIKELTNVEFEQFVSNYPNASLYQSKEYAFTMNHQKFDSLLLGLYQDNKILGASLVLIEKKHGFKYAYAPRGFVLDYQNYRILESFTKEIKHYLSKMDIIAIKINPPIIKSVYQKEYAEENLIASPILEALNRLDYVHLGFNQYFEAFKPRHEAIIDLNEPCINLFKNIKKEFRTKIRGAEKKGIRIYRGNADQLDYLYLHTKKKYPRDLKYFQDLYYFFNKNNAVEFFYAKLDCETYLKLCKQEYEKLEEKTTSLNNQILSLSTEKRKSLINKKIEVDKLYNQAKKDLIYATNLLRDEPNGIVLASALIVKRNKEVYLIMDGYNKQYKQFSAKHLLIWKLIERYNKAGFERFNLGGCIAPKANSKNYAGLNEFKLGFNSKIVEYIGDFELVTNPGLYFMYRNSLSLRSILKK